MISEKLTDLEMDIFLDNDADTSAESVIVCWIVGDSDCVLVSVGEKVRRSALGESETDGDGVSEVVIDADRVGRNAFRRPVPEMEFESLSDFECHAGDWVSLREFSLDTEVDPLTSAVMESKGDSVSVDSAVTDTEVERFPVLLRDKVESQVTVSVAECV